MPKNNDFISKDPREYKFKMGRTIASSLAGFFAGVVFASIVWVLLFIYYKTTLSG